MPGNKVEIIIEGRDRASPAFNAASRSVESLGKSAGAAQGGISQMAIGLGAMAKGFVVFQAMQMGMQTIGRFVNVATDSIIGFNASLEQSQIGWSTLLKSGDDAKAMLHELQVFAAKTPFEFQGLESSAKRLLAMGFAAKDIIPLMTDIGDASAALGAGSEGVQRMVLAMGQMRTSGRLYAQDMMQITSLGVPAWEILAQATGKNVTELRKMAEQGTITADTFIAAFQKYVKANWGGMMDQQSRTFSGAISTINDSLSIVSSTAFKPLFDRISELALKISQFVSSDDFMRWGARVNAVTGFVLDGLSAMAQGFGQALSAILNTVIGLGQAIYQALSWLNPFATHSPSLVSQVEDGTQAILSSFQKLSAVESSLGFAEGAVRRFQEATSAGMQKIGEMTAAARDKALAVFGSGVPAAFDAATAAIGRLEQQLGSMGSAINAQRGIVGALQDQMDGLNRIISGQQLGIREAQTSLWGYEDAIRAASAAVAGHRETADAARAAVDALENQLRDLMNAPIEGSKAFSDELFGLDQQMAKVQLQLTDMKLAGKTAEQMAPLEKQLDKLRTKADKVRLQEKLKFDPLRKQIKDMTNTAKEMPFAKIVAGIRETQYRLGPAVAAWQRENAALKDSENALKSVQQARDAAQRGIEMQQRSVELLGIQLARMQPAYDAEAKRLRSQEEAYRAVQQEIGDMQRVLADGASAAERELSRVEAEAKKLEAAAKGAGAGMGEGMASGAAAITDKLAGLDLSAGKAKLDEFTKEVENSKERIKKSLEPIQGFWNEYVTRPIEYTQNLLTIAFKGGEPGLALKVLAMDIGTALSGIDWNTMFKNAGDLAGKATKWLGEQWAKIDWVAVWAQAVGIGAGLLAAGLDFVSDVNTWLGQQFAKIDWSVVWGEPKKPQWASKTEALGISMSLVPVEGGIVNKMLEGAGDASGQVTKWLGEQWAKIDWAPVWSRAMGIAAGLGTALDQADWTAAGDALARALTKAIDIAFTSGEMAVDFLGKVGDWLAKIDWWQAGEKVMPHVASFVLGFVNALFDPTAWWPVIEKHWLDIVLLIVGIVATPTKLLKPILGALSKIPLAGPVLSWMVTEISTVGKRFLGGVIHILGDMAGSFIDGFLGALGKGPKGGLFSQLRKLITDGVAGLIDLGETFYLRALDLMQNMGRAIADHGPKQIVESVRNLLMKVDKFLAGLPANFFNLMKNIVESLGKAISEHMPVQVKEPIEKAFNGIVAFITDTIPNIVKAGTDWAGGLIRGIVNGLRGFRIPVPLVSSWIEDIDLMGLKIPTPRFGININWHSLAGWIPELALGGRALAAGLAIVGDRGPELLSLPRGAVVEPLPRRSGVSIDYDRLAAAMAQQPIVVQMDDTEVGRIIRNRLLERSRQIGGGRLWE